MNCKVTVSLRELELLLLFAAAFFCTLVEGSHFRGAIIMVRPQPGEADNEVRLKL